MSTASLTASESEAPPAFICENCEEVNKGTNSRGTIRKACHKCGSHKLRPELYPEHEKLHKIKDKSHIIGEFLEFIGMQGVHLMVWQEGSGEDEPHWIDGEAFAYDGTKKWCSLMDRDAIENIDYMPEGWVTWKPGSASTITSGDPIQQALAWYFQIDHNELMAEKDRMLEQIRAGQH